jgi:hypothetical protein
LEQRAVEVNALFFDNVDGLSPSPVPGDLRRLMWAEHLGYANPNHPDLQTRPAGGWLALWRDRAAAKLAALGANPPAGTSARVLEWRAEPDPKKHLQAIGLTKAQLSLLNVLEGGRSFDFTKGAWE